MPATNKVSVIIPIYNVGSYLAPCLESVLGQTHRNLEVICVNDGSTDDSPAIVKRFAEADPRIVVIDKPNGGYGHSVNRGLEAATGDWISIVEPDDLVDEHMYEDLLALAHYPDGSWADIVKGSYWLYFEFEGRKPYVERPNLMNCMPQGFCELDIQNDPEVLKHHPSIWSAIYRRDFIEQAGIRMIEPKGAGWADNPWFFETMLEAKRIMWTPAPYYYYRQTNPDASSKLKDYNLPFDRLRDIRQIIERKGITNRKILLALYQRSFDYICTSILEEFGFPENDQKLQALIQEVFDTFDPELLLEEDNGIPQRRKNYYKDFQGIYLEQIARHERCENPLISFIVAMKDDRLGLWETLHNLLNQSFEDFEVLCVDCESGDRSREIAASVASVDKRFSVIAGASSVAEGFNLGVSKATGDYIHFLRPGVVFENRRVVRDIAAAIRRFDQPADVVVFSSRFDNRVVSKETAFDFVRFDCGGIEADVTMSARPYLFTRMLNRSFIERKGIVNNSPGDPDGWSVAVSVGQACESAAFVIADNIRTETKDVIERNSLHDEDELIDFLTARYNAIHEAGSDAETPLASKISRSVIICSMAIDIGILGRYRSGQKLFETLNLLFENEYGLKSCALNDYVNYLDYGVLVEAFSLNYEEFAKSLLTKQQNGLTGVVLQRDLAWKKIKRIEESGSYLFGNSIAEIAKSVVPKNTIRKIVDAEVDRSKKK